MEATSILRRYDPHRLQQTIKWTVYILLLVNWGFYILDDWVAAQASLPDDASPKLWAQAYATSIDELGWFVLLALFELETYSLSDTVLTRPIQAVFLLSRIACYLFLAHTIYAYVYSYLDLKNAVLLSGVTDLCQVADQGASYLYSLKYTAVDALNCSELGSGNQWYQVQNEDYTVTDAAGLAADTKLAVLDIFEGSAWLAIVWLIELNVRIQDRGIAAGWLIAGPNVTKLMFYGVLFFATGYWAYYGHWLYAYDELLWIGGFAAIEMNFAEWREDIKEEQETPAND